MLELSKFLNIFVEIENDNMILEDISCDIIPGISEGKAKYLSECAVSCLERMGHSSGVQMSCSGVETSSETLSWTTVFDDRLERSTDDLQEATEHGAECISALFAIEHTPYTIVRRSRKKSGVDYWLGRKGDPLFVYSARLEISGILNDREALTSRKNKKLKQTNQSDDTGLPAFVSIVEFGTPTIEFVKK